ncbi:MAG: DNA repair protein RecO [Bacteroidetes bacterium]|nr:DNA repair protein RecO [Bacteroidota bacterium]MBK8584360.1 DNA repair protein RecO [Bacteroidota bacterium]
MLHKTRGIVFSYTEYRETSLIVKIYTELFGIQSYIVNGVRKKNAKLNVGWFQPLTLVELVVYHKERHGLQRISEIRPMPALRDIPFDVIKSTIVLFLNEVLCKAIKEEEENQLLFEFLFNTIQLFDVQQPVSKDFHLLFLIRLTRYLGFYPIQNYDTQHPFFNLIDGKFQSQIPLHPYYLNESAALNFSNLIFNSADLSARLNITSEDKKKLIENILEYYRLHIGGFFGVKSHKILEQIFE